MGTPWEEFTRRGSPASSAPMVTIQRQRNLSLNRAAYEALAEPSHLVLLFDREGNRIGIRPASPTVGHAYQVRRQQNSDSYLMSAQAFLAHYGLGTNEARRYRATLEDGMLVLDLNTTPVIVGRNSARSRFADRGEAEMGREDG